MTVCPMPYGYKLDVLKENGFELISNYNHHEHGIMNWSSNNTDVTERELFDLATYDIDEIIKSVKIRLLGAHPVCIKMK